MNYAIGTVATATVKNVANVKVMRGLNKEVEGWFYTPVKEFNLTGSFARDDVVRDIVVLDETETVPERAPYDVQNMTGRQIDAAIQELLGENEEDYGEYYDDYSGANGFWHALAQTANSNIPDGVEKIGESLRVKDLGDFTKVQFDESYDEQGDLDVELIYKFAGRTFRKACNLDSWQGGYWDGVSHEVKPVQITVTKWERV